MFHFSVNRFQFQRKVFFALVIILILLSPSMILKVSAQSDSQLKENHIAFSDISITQSSGSNATAQIDDQGNVLMESAFECPGAWSKYEFSVQNTGTIPARLADVICTDETPQEIQVSFGISKENVGEVLMPGKSCRISVVAQCDSDIVSSELQFQGAYSLTLCYEADPSASDGENNTGSSDMELPQTGDSGLMEIGILCLFSAFMACVFFRFNRRKDS